MRIKMRTTAASTRGVLHAEKEYDLPASIAQPFIDGGFAEKVTAKREADHDETPEDETPRAGAETATRGRKSPKQ